MMDGWIFIRSLMDDPTLPNRILTHVFKNEILSIFAYVGIHFVQFVFFTLNYTDNFAN